MQTKQSVMSTKQQLSLHLWLLKHPALDSSLPCALQLQLKMHQHSEIKDSWIINLCIFAGPCINWAPPPLDSTFHPLCHCCWAKSNASHLDFHLTMGMLCVSYSSDKLQWATGITWGLELKRGMLQHQGSSLGSRTTCTRCLEKKQQVGGWW